MAFFKTPLLRNQPSISSLTSRINTLSTQLTSYLHNNGYKQPDFSPASAELPESTEYGALRNQLTDVANDLIRLINGPKNVLRTQFFAHTDLAAAQVALSRRFFDHIPDDGIGLSAVQIAQRAGMTEDITRRILKMLATHRMFEEVDFKFRHTASSAFLKKSIFAAMCEASLDDFLKASSEMNNWVDGASTGLQGGDSAFAKCFGTTFYEHYEEVPEKALRFSKAMSSWSLIDDNFTILRDNFAWASLRNPKVVDVGGGNGHVSVDLARVFPNLEFIVQDISDHQLSSANAEDVQGRVVFQQHNFFNAQPVQDAAVYLCRAILHNNDDAACVQILRALVPALEFGDPDATILINDIIVPEHAGGDVTRTEENQHRQLDLLMLSLFAAKERTERDWRDLLAKTDHRLDITKVDYNPRGAGLLAVRLNREKSMMKQP